MNRAIRLGSAAVCLALGSGVCAQTVSTWLSFSWSRAWQEAYGDRFPAAQLVQTFADVGVTDIYFNHQTPPGGFLDRAGPFQSGRLGSKRDALEELLTAADGHGMKVWLSWTPKTIRKGAFAERVAAAYPGFRIALSNPQFKAYHRDHIGAVAAQYGHHESLSGISWHEVNGVHPYPADAVSGFKSYCVREFGEQYQGTGMPLTEAADKWWRRSFLYRMGIMTELIRDMTEAASEHGLKTDFIYYAPEPARRESWLWGYDILALERCVDQVWFAAWTDAGKFYHTIKGAMPDFGPSYRGQNIPKNFSYTFHGKPMSFWEGKRPIWVDFADSYTIESKGARICFGKQNFAKWLSLGASWQGGRSSARTALAVNPVSFVMQHPCAPGIEYEKQVLALMQSLSTEIDVDGFVSGSLSMADNLRHYRFVIIPADMGVGLDAASYGAYRDFVVGGGRLLVINSPVTTARRDLTQQTDLTAELGGVRIDRRNIPAFVAVKLVDGTDIVPPGKKVWAPSCAVTVLDADVLACDSQSGAPLLTTRRLGKGEVLFSALGFGPELTPYLTSIIKGATPLPVTLTQSTGVQLRESVTKGGALCVSLWGKGDAILRVDAAALGLPEGDLQVQDIITGRVIHAGASRRALAAGIPVSIRYPDQPLVLAAGLAQGLAAYRGVCDGEDVFAELERQHVRVLENPQIPIIIPEGNGPKVGVYYGGYGSAPIKKALARAGFRVFDLPRIELQAMRPADVVVIPQLKRDFVLFNQTTDDLRQYVAQGGGLLLTHDAVGYRKHAVAFPGIGKGLLNPRSVGYQDEVKVMAAHPVVAGLEVGQAFLHAFYDHVGLECGSGGTALLRDQRDLPVLVVAEAGSGKVVLNGMLTGYASKSRGGYDSEEREPDGCELQVLLNAVRWLGQKSE